VVGATFADALGAHLVNAIALPFIERHRHLLSPSQQEAFARQVDQGRREFVRTMRVRAANTPGYLAALTDEMLLEVLREVGTQLA
jgi:hypothetical protein